MKIIREDGTVRYYYYKKKRGRKKKRGPKPKKKVETSVVTKPPRLSQYKICRFTFKQERKNPTRSFRTLKDAIAYKAKLLEDNKKIKIPVKYVYDGANSRTQLPYENEYVILKRVKGAKGERPVTKIRNQFGKFVDHVSTSSEWEIYDKFPCLEEETFWVYGYNKRNDRKEYDWILENLFLNQWEEYDILRVTLYSNKIVIRYDVDKIELVICKNEHDGIRLYNMLQTDCKDYKTIIFLGGLRHGSKALKKMVALIKEKTSWPVERIYRKSTK